MMSANSASEQYWEILHLTQALARGGWTTPIPPLPVAGAAPAASPDSLVALFKKYQDRVVLGETIPPGLGSPSPKILLVTKQPLSAGEREFVRKWFENEKIALSLDGDFHTVSLPPFAGANPPYQDFFRELCLLLQPRALLCLGEKPAQVLLGAPLSLGTLRGAEYRFGELPVLTTHDPAAILALPPERETEIKTLKLQVWQDAQRLTGKVRYG